MSETRHRAFKVFLSHRYKSPATNLFFFDLFAKFAEFQFEVDLGETGTNVTRLERMVRDADAFVGIYPFPGEPNMAPTQEDLLRESHYFRLELDLAARSRKPALVCLDRCYRSVLACPAHFATCIFDSQEVSGGGGAPSAGGYSKTLYDFCASVEAAVEYRNRRGGLFKSANVGIALPLSNTSDRSYERDHIAKIESLLVNANYEPVRLPTPPVLDRRLFNTIPTLDWIIVDVGDEEGAAAVAYFHGQFIPTMRLKRVGEYDFPSPLERVLYGGIDVGYGKDTVRWRTADDLNNGIAQRIKAIDFPSQRISTHLQAQEYFSRAGRRKERVFLSYSGEDLEFAAKISTALQARFQKVFDYKDGKSIRPGEPWLNEIFEQLSTAAIAIPLLSTAYFESGNCTHEAQKITAAVDSKKLRMIPVKLYAKKLDLPDWFPPVQYDRTFQLDNDPEALVLRIVDLIQEKH